MAISGKAHRTRAAAEIKKRFMVIPILLVRLRSFHEQYVAIE
jgi:hypothetical protein